MSDRTPLLTMAPAAIALALAGCSGAEEQRPVRVLVDRSHEWLFAYDDLAERVLRPAGVAGGTAARTRCLSREE